MTNTSKQNKTCETCVNWFHVYADEGDGKVYLRESSCTAGVMGSAFLKPEDFCSKWMDREVYYHTGIIPGVDWNTAEDVRSY